jgi:hypothetical protein
MASVTHPNDGQTAIDGERSTALQRLSSVFVRLLAEAEWRTLAVLASLAFCHGLIYLAIVPPWQHYDEPTHFEYAALLARTSDLVERDTVALDINHSIADSMYRFRFWTPEVRPLLLGPRRVFIGYDQEVHPPLYYALIAIPIGWMQAFPVELQLYAARLVSVIFLALVVLATWRITCVVTPDEPMVQLAIPLLVFLTPAYSDLMSAVNNDVLVNFSITAMLLGCMLLIRDGLRPAALALALLGLLVALMAKRTAVAAVIPFSLSLLWALRRQPLRWWFWALGAALLGLLAALALRVELASGGAVVQARSWLSALDAAYLRLNIDLWLISVSDWQRSLPLYQRAMERLFAGYWIWFSWGQFDAGAFWIWLFRVLVPLCGLGLIRSAIVYRGAVELWQQRVIWAFFVTVLAATIAALLRIHPLPPEGQFSFLTSGRYTFFVITPLLWLLALGWQNLMPASWRPYSLPMLIALFVIFDISTWALTFPNFFYRQVAL